LVYKANRTDYSIVNEEDNPFSQLPFIFKALNYLQIPYLEVVNNEADDFIASIISNKGFKEYEYVIVSTDRDFIQLVNKSVSLYVPGGKRSILFNENEVFQRFHVMANDYVTFKALIGDKSDNIKGVNGIGKVTAAKILKYHSIQYFIMTNSESKLTKKILENRQLIIKNIKLIQLNTMLDTSNVIFRKIPPIISCCKVYEIIEKIGEK